MADAVGNSWLIGFAGAAITSVTFLAISAALAYQLQHKNQWRSNPLGVGTMLIFLTCGGGHLVHTIQLAAPWFGLWTTVGHAARVEYSDWHMWLVDGMTAAAGMAYWLLRRNFPHLVSGTALFEDLRQRQKRALRIHDGVVQGLAKAKLALELEADHLTGPRLDEALTASQRVVDDLLKAETRNKEARHG